MNPKSFSHITVLPDGVQPSRIDVDLDAGVIVAINPDCGSMDQSCLLFPGFVDIHVHAREFPKPSCGQKDLLKKWESMCAKEVLASAASAAINGGVTCFAAMPNDPSPPDKEITYDKKLSLGKNSKCPVIFFASITEHSEPWADLPYKLYLDKSATSISFSKWSTVENTLSRYKGRRVFFHAEDPDILQDNSEQLEHWKKRPPEAETRAVNKILDLTHKYGLVSHICHVSTEGSVKLIREYNESSSTKVTCEVTPHHLFFSVDEHGYYAGGRKIEIPGYILNCNPPLRSEHDRQTMIEALRSNLIQVLASDHAPHLMVDKKLGVSGIPHLDTLGPFVGWLVKDCGFHPTRIAQILSEEPSRIMAPNMTKKYGRLQKEFGASFTVIDFGKTTDVGPSKNFAPNRRLFTRCGWSPFEHVSLPARIRFTVVNGIIFEYNHELRRLEET
ncbi:MAG: amidohydrolase family protein [Desulfomonilaceae bacterium]